MSTVYGLPTIGKNPEFDKATFSIFVPKLKDWIYEPANEQAYQKFLDICNNKINKSVFGDDWEMAMSYAIAHYICITDPMYVQAVDGDTAVGGIMSSRSVNGLSYSYDLDKTITTNPAYNFWLRTGYGTQLVNLILAHGWVGVLVVH
jgi:hypothetical protein